MKRNNCYKNSFSPRIKGDISTEDGQTQIEVKLQKRPMMFVWLIVSFIFCISIIIALITNDFHYINLVYLILVMVILVLPWAAFKFDSDKSKKELSRIFESEG